MRKETKTTSTPTTNGQALKTIMQLEGKTAGDIAHALNVTEETAKKKIAGATVWRISEMDAIAALLHMSGREINIVFFPAW